MALKQWISDHKKTTALLVVLLGLAVMVFIASRFVAVSFPSSEAHSVFSAVFDVPQMHSVNKMTIQTATGLTTITKRSLINKVVRATTVHNSAGGFRCFSWGDTVETDDPRPGNEICLYNDDTLVRRMPQSIGVDGCWGDSKYAAFRAVILYQKDALHHITDGNEIWGYLSVGLVEKLEAELQRQGNTYFTE